MQHKQAGSPTAIGDKMTINRKSRGMISLQIDEVASKFRKVKRRMRN